MLGIKKNKIEFEEYIRTEFFDLLAQQIGSYGKKKTVAMYDTIRGIVGDGEQLTEEEENILNENVQNNCLGISLISYTCSSLHQDVAVGRGALMANTTGAQNVAVGYQALIANTTGARNVAVGYQALIANTTGAQNVAVGCHALHVPYWKFTNEKLGPIEIYLNGDTYTIFCYYLQLSTKEDAINNIQYFSKWHSYPAQRLYGISPIGATIISKVDINFKKEIIKNLMEQKHEPTRQDERLQMYIAYDTIYKQQFENVKLLLLIDDLVYDVKEIVMDFIVETSKKELTFW